MKQVCQGEIWWVHPTPKMGSEQRGTRPALVIQNDDANMYINTTIIAIISRSGKKNMPEMVKLDESHGVIDGSFADFAQIYTIDKTRLVKKIGKIEEEKWNEVEEALQSIFFKTL